MDEKLRLLFQLHLIDKKFILLYAKAASLNAAAEMKHKYASAKAAAAKCSDEIGRLDVESRDGELKARSLEIKMADYEKKLYSGSITNAKELAAMEKEIAILKEQKSRLENDLLPIYETARVSRGTCEKASKAAVVWEKRFRHEYALESRARAEIEAEVKQLQAMRHELTDKLADPAMVAKYDSIRKRVGDSGIAPVAQGRCQACHVSVTPYLLRQVVGESSLETCENCGRILVPEALCAN